MREKRIGEEKRNRRGNIGALFASVISGIDVTALLRKI